jgi:hypothetical protein
LRDVGAISEQLGEDLEASYNIRRLAAREFADALEHAIDPPLDEKALQGRMQVNIAGSNFARRCQQNVN